MHINTHIVAEERNKNNTDEHKEINKAKCLGR